MELKKGNLSRDCPRIKTRKGVSDGIYILGWTNYVVWNEGVGREEEGGRGQS